MGYLKVIHNTFHNVIKTVFFLHLNYNEKPETDQMVEKTNGLKKKESNFEKVGLAEPVDTNELENLINQMWCLLYLYHESYHVNYAVIWLNYAV